MPTNPPTIYKKSATSTEIWYAQIQGLSITGTVQDPTSATVSCAVLRAPDSAGDVRAPALGDYASAAWRTFVGPRYMAEVLLGPGATLIPTGPTSSEDEVLWELWVRLQSGSEDVRWRAGVFAVTP